MKKHASDNRNALPANVANIVAEFERLVAIGSADARLADSRQVAKSAPALVIRGN